MSVEQQFRVNEYITLKLERLDDRLETVIYAGGERFRQCKYLLLKISVKRISRLDEIESIDEAAEKLDHSPEPGELYEPKIPPETEFWGHCSNLQVWAEHHYDTRLIHSNLAFPLLKRLTELGDPQAKRAFKDEIAKRLASGHRSTVLYLHKEGYLDYLSQEERITAVRNMPQEKFEKFWNDQELYFLEHEGRLRVLLEDREAEAIVNIEKEIKRTFAISLSDYDNYDSEYIRIENGHVTELSLFYSGLDKLSAQIRFLEKLKELELSSNKFTILPQIISELDQLKSLYIVDNELNEIPAWIGNLRNLEIFDLRGNQINNLPNSILKLDRLEDLGFDINEEIKERAKRIIHELSEKNVKIR